MSKYQEALKTVEKSCISVAMEFNFGELFEEDEKALSTLQELVDKATPKKLEQFGNNGYCPKCHYLVHSFYEYCCWCGQALEKWSDEDGD